MAKTSAVTATVNAVAALAVAGYAGAVIWQRNTTPFILAAKDDAGYLEFLIAAAILKAALDNKTLRPYFLPITIVGVIGAAIRFFTISPQAQHGGTGAQVIKERLAAFGAGKLSLFGLFAIDGGSANSGGTTVQQKGSDHG